MDLDLDQAAIWLIESKWTSGRNPWDVDRQDPGRRLALTRERETLMASGNEIEDRPRP